MFDHFVGLAYEGYNFLLYYNKPIFLTTRVIYNEGTLIYRDHSFSTYGKFSEKTSISYPLIHTRMFAYQEVRNVCFSEILRTCYMNVPILKIKNYKISPKRTSFFLCGYFFTIVRGLFRTLSNI